MKASAKRFPWLPASAQPKARRAPRYTGGRPPKVTDDQLVALVSKTRTEPAPVVCIRAMHEYGISRSVFYSRVPQLSRSGRLVRSVDGYGRSYYSHPKPTKAAK